ncbi:MAG: type II toxin-antitoxin system MqsA family antitoxin [Burkholderiales bacterium]
MAGFSRSRGCRGGCGTRPHQQETSTDQSEAATLVGGSKNAFSRYEKGKAKPVAAVINLFSLLDRHPELLNELRYGG